MDVRIHRGGNMVGVRSVRYSPSNRMFTITYVNGAVVMGDNFTCCWLMKPIACPTLSIKP